ncbi:MAG: 16S rRNA (cytosine(967)-C(5))-methyltransferase RsmB [Deltaproteobacteria bacterium]|nr:16S rRNA (cytosine(967)-C(5))-methyltransferase RsmB [Deltaproteobacteria bacterium]
MNKKPEKAPKNASETARVRALRILERVEGGAYADILLESGLEGLSEADASLATELVYGVLRWRLKLDWIIDSFSSIKTKKLERRVLNALRLGCYQLLFLTKIPASAAINESVNLVKKGGTGRAGFVNAILRKIDSERGSIRYPDMDSGPIRHVSILYSHPEWMVKRWVDRFGVDEAIGLCAANNIIPPRVLRVNTLLTTREGLMSELAGEGLEVKAAGFSPDGIEILKGRVRAKDPRYYIQDEASQLIPYLLALKPGETVLDACAAPGGKTTHMAQIMRNSGSIYALDKHNLRLKAIVETAERFKIGIIKTIEADSGQTLPFKESFFDAILCDAPCSGLGVLRRVPDIKITRGPEDIKALSLGQKAILNNVSGYLKRGGRLVYSTCTFEPEETEDVIREFLDTHKDFILEKDIENIPGGRALVDEEGFLRTYPHRHGLDGFFAAALKKI